MSHLPRLPLIQSPTPCHRLNRLSDELGIDLWVKRDDLTGFAFGGNKGRKLEFLMPKILASGCDTVVTSGASQSNFVRQLAAACAMFGLKFEAMTMPLPFEPGRETGMDPAFRGGNSVLNRILGAKIRELPNGSWDELEAATEAHAAELRAAGRNVLTIPLGGSSVEGAYAFTLAAEELPGDFDFVVCPTSSGSTHAGLAHQTASKGTQVIGICADPEPEMVDVVADLSNQLDELLGTRVRLRASDIRLRTDFVGPGYGVPSDSGNAAIELMARREGIFLDPIYSGKAFAGLLAMVANKELKGRILFWHTGGLPTLFADIKEPRTK